MATRSLTQQQNDTMVARITTLELVVTNHCSATNVRLASIEINMLDLKTDLKELSQQVRALER